MAAKLSVLVKFTVTVAGLAAVLIALGVKLNAVRFGAAELCASPMPGKAISIEKAIRLVRSIIRFPIFVMVLLLRLY